LPAVGIIYAGNELDLLTVLSYSYDKKLRKIESLIRERKRETEYSRFLALAEQCRSLRNKLVHGHWDFIAHLPKPIRFHVPAPFEEKGDFAQDEFSAQVGYFERTNSLFVELQKKHPIAHESKGPNKSVQPTPTAVTPRAKK
jgi:hypothetical protein